MGLVMELKFKMCQLATFTPLDNAANIVIKDKPCVIVLLVFDLKGYLWIYW
jgi:hypothetical protein